MRVLQFDFDAEDVEQRIAERRPDSGIVPRPYQQLAINNVFERWNAGDTSTLVCLPTGTGKSIVFSEVMRRWAKERQ